MNRLVELKKSVASLYASKLPTRADWADWLYDNHVIVAAEFAEILAKRHGANIELSVAASLLHDVADATMSRFDPTHAKESLKISRKLLNQAGYSDKDMAIVVDDAIRYHSCHDGEMPQSIEGKVLATADSYAHLKTDFYIFAANQLGKSLEELKNWTLKKIERDINDKCFFDDAREELMPDYLMIKELFSR